jgi:anti-anti-sigma factor
VVVLDRAGATFIDSTALGVVIRAADQLTAAGKRLFIVAPEGPVSRLLELTNLKQHFTVYADREEAVSAASVAAS